MLINSREILNKCRDLKIAIPSANFIDLNSIRAYIRAAEDYKLPLIVAYAQSHKNLISLEEAAIIGKFYAEKSKVPIVLHLDHGEDIETVFKAIDLGFTSVMIDASNKAFRENILITKKVVDYAHKYNVTVESELGHVGANDTSESNEINESIYTEVEDVIEFVSSTKVDSLAVSIGTAHGLYKGIPKLNFERLKEISNSVDIPLVLHGGSSTGDKNLNKCVKNGISKINIYTDFITAAHKDILNSETNNYAEMNQVAESSFINVLKHYYHVFDTIMFK